MLWLRFALAGALDLMNGLYAYVPIIPLFTPSLDLSAYATTKPWTAARPLVAWIYPFVVGLGYFLPLNLSLSAWFFYLVWKVGLVFLAHNYGTVQCRIAHASRAPYLVWCRMLREEPHRITVELLLNRASGSADMTSDLPYAGEARIHMKKNVSLRVPWLSRLD